MITLIALWQVPRMYGVGGKLSNGIKSTYVKSNLWMRVSSVS